MPIKDLRSIAKQAVSAQAPGATATPGVGGIGSTVQGAAASFGQAQQSVQPEQSKGFLKSTGEVLTGMSSQVYNYVGNIASDMVRLSKWVNPIELANMATGKETTFTNLTSKVLKEAGENIKGGIQETAQETLGLDPNSAFTQGGEMMTNIIGTISSSMMAGKAVSSLGKGAQASQFGTVKNIGNVVGKFTSAQQKAQAAANAGLSLKGLSGFALSQALRAPQTIAESVFASQAFARGGRGYAPTVSEIRNNSVVDLGVQLALGTVGFLAKPIIKAGGSLLTGASTDAVETALNPQTGGRVGEVLDGKWDLNSIRKSAEEAFPEIQKQANDEWIKAMDEFIPDHKNMRIAQSWKTKMMAEIQDAIDPRMATLTGTEQKQVRKILNETIGQWDDLTFDGVKNLSIRVGNEINEAKLAMSLGDNFSAVKNIVNNGVDSVLNEVTENSWGRVQSKYRPFKELQSNLKPLKSANKKTVESFLRSAEVSGIDKNVTVQYLEQLDEIAGTSIMPDLRALNAAKQLQEGSGLFGTTISKIGLGQMMGELMTKIGPALGKTSFKNYMAMPTGLTKSIFIPLDKKQEPIQTRVGLPNKQVFSQGGISF